ncbi:MULTISPECIES: AAWKG family protein [Streptomyces]|nr:MULTISPECIES: AAWKG family protein [Streptomyces]AZK97779.1 hypothetical protein B7R87_30725 [Streptomyces tsukubensis]EIF93974.1 hypothetical protein [Streptomyces tsukubensis NRRL18488]
MPMDNPLWEEVVGQITGFNGGTREAVGKVGGTSDANGNLGGGWIKADIQKIDMRLLAEEKQTAAPDYNPERVVRFYDYAGPDSAIVKYCEVRLSVPWSSSTGNDFSDGGVAGKFDWLYGKALEHLKGTGSIGGFESLTAKDSADLRTFVTTAKSFDEVQEFFGTYAPHLEKWVTDLGGDDAAWKGNGADAFRELIAGLHLGYKEFADLLAPTGNPTAATFPSSDGYTPKSVVGDNIMRGGEAIHAATVSLHNAWSTWTGKPGWLPTHHLDDWIDKVIAYLNVRNIANTRVEKLSRLPNANFSIYYDEGSGIGDLRTQEAWTRLGNRAYESWRAGLETDLDPTAANAARTLNNALADIGESPSTFTFNLGFTDLRSLFNERETERKAGEAEREAERQKEEMEKKKEELEKGLGGGGGGGGQIPPPPGLGPNDLGGKDGKGNPGGGPGGLKPPPGLDLNPGNNGSKGPGTGGPGSLKPPPGLDLIGGGDKGVVRNPDGSVSIRNPDGSYTTTYPDGRKETTPPGVLPPGLGLNPGGLPGTGTPAPPLKTVKGPDGSTTSYNQDGSRTVTHKDGASTTIGRDGTVTTLNPGGSTTVLHRDGSQSVTYPDGTKTTFKPDGSSVTQYKNGTVVQRAADGTLTTTDAEGNKTVDRPKPGETVKNPDGSTTTYNKDGSATTVHANGIRTTVGADGTITTLDPDGTKTVSRLGQSTSTIEYADGSVAKVEKDGTVVTTYKDGSTTRLGPDGTYTTTDADGKKSTEHLNPLGGKAGAVTQHHADGSTTTRYPDGTVDQEYKDGRRKVTYPDGRTVTTDADGRTVSVTGGKGSSGIGSGGSGRFSDLFDQLDRERKKSPWVPNLYSGGAGGSGGNHGSGGPPPPSLNPNTIGSNFAPPGAGPGIGSGSGSGSGGTGGGRSIAGNETSAHRARPNPTVVEETAARRPATSSGMMPMMPPPMGGMGGMGGGQGNQGEERERATWVSEDEEVWGTDEGGVAGVIGR